MSPCCYFQFLITIPGISSSVEKPALIRYLYLNVYSIERHVRTCPTQFMTITILLSAGVTPPNLQYPTFQHHYGGIGGHLPTFTPFQLPQQGITHDHCLILPFFEVTWSSEEWGTNTNTNMCIAIPTLCGGYG